MFTEELKAQLIAFFKREDERQRSATDIADRYLFLQVIQRLELCPTVERQPDDFYHLTHINYTQE